MTQFWALTLRELKAFWYSPIAYVVGAMFLLLQGVVFALLLTVLNDPRIDPSFTMAQFFFSGTFFFWFVVLVIPPLITMRTFSDEKRSGTMEFLLSAPVTDAQVVLAKFVGAWLCYAILWMGTVPLFLLFRTISSFDWGPVIAGYVGTLLMGSVLIAVGILSSSLTRNQVIAAVISFVAIILLFSIGVLEVFIREPEAAEMIRHLSLMEQLRAFSKGLIDTRPVILYGSLTAIFLFLTGRVIGHPRWRA